MWKLLKQGLVLGLGLLAYASTAFAGNAILVDQSFGPDLSGANVAQTNLPAIVNAIAFKDGGIYNGCGQMGGQTLIGQITPTGNFDFANFNAPQGFTVIPIGSSSYCLSLATQPSDQKTVFAGSSQTGSDSFMAVGRLTSAGSLDTSSFATPNGYIVIEFPTDDSSPQNANVIEMELQPSNGFIVLGGTSLLHTSPTYQNVLSVVRLDTSGALDLAFGTGGIQSLPIGDTVTATGLAIQSDEKIVIGGSVMSSGLPKIAVARFTSSGTLDATYGSGAGYIQYASLPADAIIVGLDIQKVGANQDKVIVAVASTSLSQVYAFRFTTSGDLDTTFGSAGVATVNFPANSQPNLIGLDVAEDGSDNIIIFGVLTTVSNSYLIKLTVDGLSDSTFGDLGGVPGLLTVLPVVAGQTITVNAAKFDGDSKPVTAGYTASVTNALVFERFKSSNLQSVSILSPLDGQASTTNPQVFVNGICTQSGARIDVLVDSVLTLQTVSNHRGEWSAGMTGPLATGSHAIEANLIYDLDTIVASATSTIVIA